MPKKPTTDKKCPSKTKGKDYKEKVEKLACGRPREYRLEIGDLFFSRLAAGESLNKICQDPDMPALVTFFRWLDEIDGFRYKYDKAREQQAERWANEIVEIADNSTEEVNRSRLKVDTRKWIVSKLIPKKYSDKMSVDHGGSVKIVISQDDAECL